MMKVECFECGEDCSSGYATYKGDPYHFCCLPMPPKRQPPKEEEPPTSGQSVRT